MPPRPRFRYGRAGMQIHLALDELPVWAGPEADRLARTAIVHVTPGLDGVSRAVNEAERGLLPAEATIVVGQPCAVDPSRAPDGKWIVWIQLQELPAGRVKGDAAGELDVGDGTWTEELREAYADRICARLGEQLDEPLPRDARARRPLPRRPRGARLQPRAGRHLRRLVRARPEPPLATERRHPRASDPGRRPLAHRRQHAPRSGPRRGLRLPRRQGAHAPVPAEAVPPEAAGSAVTRLALSEISTVGASFADDVGRVRRSRLRRDRDLGVQAPLRRRGQPRAARRAGARGRQLRAGDPVVPAARPPGHGRPVRSGRAPRSARGIGSTARRATARSRSCA